MFKTPVFYSFLFLAYLTPMQASDPDHTSAGSSSGESPMSQKHNFDPLFSEQAPLLVKFSETKTAIQGRFPSYPESARIKKIQGGVLVEVWVDSDGTPTKAVAIWGREDLYSVSEEYCKTWKFKPYQQDTKPIPVRFRMLVLFRLNKQFEMPQVPKEYVFK